MLINEITEMAAVSSRHADTNKAGKYKGSAPLQYHPRGQVGPLGEYLYWTPTGEVADPTNPDKTTTVKRTTVHAFPDSDTGIVRYNTEEELNQAVNAFVKKNGKINWVNASVREGNPNKYRGFAVVKVRNENNEEHWIGKYLPHTQYAKVAHDNIERAVNPKVNDEYFDSNDFGPELHYYSTNKNSKFGRPTQKIDTKSALTLTALQPGNILGDSVNTPQTVDQIVSKVKQHFGDEHPLSRLTQEVANGNRNPVLSVESDEFSYISQLSKADKLAEFNRINKDFTELLHPIAFVRGGIDGDKPNIDIKDAKISYTKSTGGLIDSIIHAANGDTLAISSKYRGGTPPTIGKEIAKKLDHLPKEVVDMYPDEVNALRNLSTSSAEPKANDDGPLRYAQSIGIIKDPKTIDYFKKVLIKNKRLPYNKLDRNTVPKELLGFIDSGPASTSDGRLPYYSALAKIMQEVCDRFNKDNRMSDLLKRLMLEHKVVTIRTIPSNIQVNNDLQTISENIDFILSNKENNISLTRGTTYGSGHANNRLQFTVGEDEPEDKLVQASPPNTVHDLFTEPDEPKTSDTPNNNGTIDKPAPIPPKPPASAPVVQKPTVADFKQLMTQHGIKGSQLAGMLPGNDSHSKATALAGLQRLKPDEIKQRLIGMGIDLDNPDTVNKIKLATPLAEDRTLRRLKELVKY